MIIKFVLLLAISVTILGSISFADAQSAPDPPTSLGGVFEKDILMLSWTAPGYDGGSALSAYKIEYRAVLEYRPIINDEEPKWSTSGYISKLDDSDPPEITTMYPMGLAPGIEYQIRVKAVNSVGESTPSNVITRTNDDINDLNPPNWDPPGKVQNLRASILSGTEVRLFWDANLKINPSTNRNYATTYEITGHGQTETASGTVKTIDGLTKGSSYTFEVRAVTEGGKSDPSNVTVHLVDLPGKPTDLKVKTRNGGDITLTWEESNIGSTGNTHYIIQYREIGTRSWEIAYSNSEERTLSLKFDKEYEFQVKTVNERGEGVFSNIVRTTSTAYLQPIETLTVTGTGYDSVTLSWNAPPSNTIVTDYKIQYRVVGGGNWKIFDDGTSTATTATVTGLSYGKTYSFAVWPVNTDQPNGPHELPDNSPATTPKIITTVKSTTKDPIPEAPTNLQAQQAGSNTIKLTWDAPNQGGSPITGYEISVHDRHDGSKGRNINTYSSNTSYTVGGLANGHLEGTDRNNLNTSSTCTDAQIAGGMCFIENRYEFSVSAKNSFGQGPYSDSTNASAYPNPDPPTNLQAQAGNGNVRLTWDYSGNTDVDDYIIDYRIVNSGNNWKDYKDNEFYTTKSVTIRGLTNGTTYEFRVAVFDIPGGDPSNTRRTGNTGPYSDIVTATPIQTGFSEQEIPELPIGQTENPVSKTKPDAPTGLVATPRDGSIQLDWIAPADPPGAPVTGYTIQYRNTGTWQETSADENTATIENLTNGTLYKFRVIAVNEVGDSEPSSIVTATPVTKPDSPRNLQATPGDGQVKLTWSAPSNGGSKITDYIIEYRSGATWSIFPDGTSINPSSIVRNLTNGTSYEFRVIAVNEIGDSEPSSIVTAIPLQTGTSSEQETPIPELSIGQVEISEKTKPVAPTGLIATPGNGSIQLDWTASASNYIVEYKETGGSWQEISTNQNTATITGLTNDTLYEFQVMAVNEIGRSQPSTISAIPSDEFGDVIIGLINSDIQTATLAVERFNESHNTKLGLTIYAGDTLTGIKTLHELDINYMIGPVTADSLDYINQNNIVFINDRTTTPDISKLDNIFSLVPNDTNLGIVFSQLFLNDEIKNVLTIHRDDSWGNSIFESLSNNIGETITLHPPIKYTNNYQNMITQLEEYDLSDTAILLLGFEETVEIITLADQIDTKWYSSFDSNIESVITPIVSVPENIINESLESFAVYDGVTLLGHAIESGDDIIESIPNIAINLAAASDNLTLNEYGDLAFVTYDITTVQDGKSVILDTITISNIEPLDAIDVIVFNDTNNNTIKDNGEQGVQTNVYLLAPPSIIEGSTNLFGKYSFVNPPDADMVFIIIDNTPHFKNIEETVYFPLNS